MLAHSAKVKQYAYVHKVCAVERATQSQIFTFTFLLPSRHICLTEASHTITLWEGGEGH